MEPSMTTGSAAEAERNPTATDPELAKIIELRKSIAAWQAEEAKRRAEEAKRRAEEAKERAEEAKERTKRRAEEAEERTKRRAERLEREKKLDRRLEEIRLSVAREQRKTERQLRKSEREFTSKWGRLMESLIEGDLVKLLAGRGIAVDGTSPRAWRRRNGEHYEIDILAVNGTEVVAVEVKTTLRPKHVKHFCGKLEKFKRWMPEYAGHTLYGAVAYLRVDSEAHVHAERQGLFVIRATGSSASIRNAPDFTPRTFG